MLDTHARKYADSSLLRIARWLLKIGLSPNQVTAAAFVVGLSSGAAAYLRQPVIAVVLLWLSGLLDAVDGTMARMTGKSSLFGAVLDVVSDRIVELCVIWALALLHPQSLVALLGLVSSILLSMTVFLTTGMYAKNTGGKSFYYQAGLMERTEGFLAFTAILLFQGGLCVLTWIYTGLIAVTIVQRLAEAYRLARQTAED